MKTRTQKIGKILLLAYILLSLGGLFYRVAQADDSVTNKPPVPDTVTKSAGSTGFSTLKNPLQASSIEKLLFSFVDILIFIGVIVAVFVFIFIGFKLVMAQGNEDALKEAKQWFLYAVIGTAILIGSKMIVSVIENTLVSSGLVKKEVIK
jgi:hypothetical protein